MKKAMRGTAENATSAPQGTNGSSTSESTLYIMDAYRGTWRKKNRWRRRAKKSRRRFAGRNWHHFLLPKSRGGDKSLNNLLLIDIEKHEAWHRIFKNATAEEVLALLERVVRAKKHQTKRVA